MDLRTAVIVDEHPLWLDAVEHVLHQVPVDVLGKATSLDEATRLIEEVSPDLLVVEITMAGPDTTGFLWLPEVCARFRNLKAIVLSASEDPSHIADALAGGAVAYVVKKAHPEDLAVAVRQVYEHSIYLPRPLDSVPRVASPAPIGRFDLTRRELEILCLVAEGMPNAELAKMLWVTEQTVKFHLSNIYRKLDVSNRTEASRWAQIHGLLPVEPVRSSSAA
jgi:DNA-binding NarL/FixJ family response regulator